MQWKAAGGICEAGQNRSQVSERSVGCFVKKSRRRGVTRLEAERPLGGHHVVQMKAQGGLEETGTSRVGKNSGEACCQ